MSSLVPAPLAPASLVPESMAAASPPLPFLSLAFRSVAEVAYPSFCFVGPVKLVPTILAGPPAPISPQFSTALIYQVSIQLAVNPD